MKNKILFSLFSLLLTSPALAEDFSITDYTVTQAPNIYTSVDIHLYEGTKLAATYRFAKNATGYTTGYNGSFYYTTMPFEDYDRFIDLLRHESPLNLSAWQDPSGKYHLNLVTRSKEPVGEGNSDASP